ncbi:MAG TPA: alpha amylase C-terminal domain-containing protein, partial [Streptosporangiaceae bacterium]
QLLFMGSEFGQGEEWSEQRGLPWHLLDYDRHKGVQRLVTDLNRVYTGSPALWRRDASPDGFQWIDANDTAGNVLSFVRQAGESGGERAGELLACIVNFSGDPHHGYRMGLPRPGRWRELVNTDAGDYGGSGTGNLGSIDAIEVPWHGMPASAVLTLPPLAALWLAPEPAQAAGSAGPAGPASSAADGS